MLDGRILTSRMSDVGCRVLTSRMWDFNKLDVGCLQVGCRMSDFYSRMSDGTYKLPYVLNRKRKCLIFWKIVDWSFRISCGSVHPVCILCCEKSSQVSLINIKEELNSECILNFSHEAA